MAINVGSAIAYLELNTAKFEAGIKNAQSSLNALSDTSAGLSDKMSAMGKSFTSVGSSMTKSLTLPITAVGTAAVKVTSDFDTAMSKVKALSGATGDEFDSLRKKAIEMGSSTKFTATEAAEAFSYMALAGWDTSQMLDGISGMLNLAAAGELDLATASDMVTDYLTAFGKEASYSTQMSDALAKASATTNTSVLQLGEAFNNTAVNAASSGLSIEETTAALGIMANSGKKGAEAGTALSAVFRDMTDKMEDGNIQIGKTNVAIMDSNGNYRKFSDIIRDVEKAISGMGDAEQAAALSTTFTSRSIQAMRILVAAGADDLDRLTESLYGSSGAAKDMSETMLDNLSGSITLLKSAIEAFMIKIGDALVPTIRSIAEWINKIVDKLNTLSDEEIQQIVKVAAIVAALGPVLIIIGKIFTAISTIISILSQLSTVFGVVKMAGTALISMLSLITPEIMLIIAAVGLVIAAFVALYKNWDSVVEMAKDIWGSLVGFFEDTFNKIKDAMSNFWNGVTDWLSNAFDSVDNFLNEKLLGSGKSFWSSVKISWIEGGKGISGIVEVLYQVVSNLWNNLFDFIENLTGIKLDAIRNKIHGALGVIKDVFETFFLIIQDIFTGHFENIKGRLENFFREIKNDLKLIFGDLVDAVTNFFSTLTSFVSNAFDSLQSTVANLFNGIKSTVLNIFETFKDLVINLFNSIFDTLSNLIQSLKDVIQSFVDIIKLVFDTATSVMKTIVSSATDLVKGIVEAIGNVVKSFVSSISSIWENLMNGAEEVVSKVIDWVKTKIDDIKNTFTNLPNMLFEIGKNMITKLWEGMKATVEPLVRWIQDKFSGITSIFDKVSNVASNLKNKVGGLIHGSHANGLSYVPFDGYVAELHEGERVLTKEENKKYNKEKNGGDTFIFNSPEAIDEYKAARLLKQTKNELELNF